MAKSPFQNFVVRFREGEIVFEEGDRAATMFIVQSGKVRLFREGEGAVRELGVMEKGDFFGEMSILEGLPRTNCAEAVETSELIEINSSTFDKMIKGNIEIAIRMLRKLSIRLREAEGRLDELQASGVDAEAKPRIGRAERKQADVAATSGMRLELEENGTVFSLPGPEALIGRYDPVTELRPDVDLSDHDLKRSVSRRHARILQTDDGHVIVEEVGALNGTFVNGTRLTAGEPHAIEDGDRVGLGVVKLLFRC